MATILTPFVDRLPILSMLRPTARAGDKASYFIIEMRPALTRLHSSLPTTNLWGFNGLYPGPIIEARADRPTIVTWLNRLPGPHPIRPIITANPGGPSCQTQPGREGRDLLPLREPIPVWTSIHLHGGRTPPDSDGMPVNAYFPNSSVTSTYPNRQRAATLWYHDNAMGQTRVNMYAGLFGAYLLRDSEEDALNLPRGAYELTLLLNDINLDMNDAAELNGDLLYKLDSSRGEFKGPMNVVNGKIWPYLEVQPRHYRVRLINAAVARSYRLSLNNADGSSTQSVSPWLIGTDGGLLESPVRVPPYGLVLGPGERADLILNFKEAAGESLNWLDINAEEDNGTVPATTGREVMQFRVTAPIVDEDTFHLPLRLSRASQSGNAVAAAVRQTRHISLVPHPEEPNRSSLNGQNFFDRIDVQAELDSSEIWEISNQSSESHMFHVHMVQMRVLSRNELVSGMELPLEICEQGRKDTVRLPPYSKTRLLLTFNGYTGLYVYRYRTGGQRDTDTIRPFLVVPKGMVRN